jgi:hypothetical protein
MMKNILWLCIFCNFLSAYAQVSPTETKKTILATTTMDKFIEQFNFEDSLLLSTLNDEERINIIRSDVLKYQFNYCDTSITNKSLLIQKFIDKVSAENIKIKQTDDNWYALVKGNFNITLSGKKEKSKIYVLDLVLKFTGNDEMGYKWALLSVNGDFFNEIKKGNSVIKATNNEVNFSDLRRVCTPENYLNLVPDNFMIDNTSAFLFLLKTKVITYHSFISTQYHFLQINDFLFTVDYFNRTDCNEGWLISSLKEMNDDEKNAYRQNVLHLNINNTTNQLIDCNNKLDEIRNILK